MAATVIILPPYTPSPPVPSYSPEPAHDERRVEHTPRSRTRPPAGNYIKKSGRETLVLTEQEEAAEHPTYGRHATISGFLALEDRETVSEVVLKIKGKMEVMASERGSASVKLVNDTYTLWLSHTSNTSACPSTIPFTAILPTTFNDGDKCHPLPPSYDVPVNTVAGLFVKSSYSISIIVTRVRSRKLQFLSKSNIINVPFKYNPRTRPFRPIQPPTCNFFSDIKTMPEEWRQVVAEVSPRPKSVAQPIEMHLFLPMVEIFGLEDTIPFHVQLTGPVASLREFVPETPNPTETVSCDKMYIQGTLVRQIVVDINHQKIWRNITIGHAKLSSCPPGALSDSWDVSLDWDGEIRTKDNVSVGMFDAGVVKIQDFLVVELSPPNSPTAQFAKIRQSHPIRLVTDSWEER